MEAIQTTLKKIEYELPIFLIVAFKLPYSQIKSNGISFLLISAVTAFLLGKVIRRAEKSEKVFYLFFVAIFLSGDMMKTIFMPTFTGLSVIVYKLASLLCFIAAVLMLRKPLDFLQKPVFKHCIPVLCVLGIMGSPGFVFFFVPVILIVMAYEKNKMNETRFDYNFLATWLIPLLLAVLLISLSFFGEKKYMGIIDIGFVFKILAWSDIFKVFITILPLIGIFTFIWINAYKSSDDKKLKRIVLFCLLEPLFVVVSNVFFYYAVSDGWKYYFFIAAFTQFCMLFYFWDSREKAIVDSARKIGDFFRKYPISILAIAIYLTKISDLFYKI